jgi:hypothetical protein
LQAKRAKADLTHIEWRESQRLKARSKKALKLRLIPRHHSQIGEGLDFVAERHGSGNGERKTLLTRQIAFEPLPASDLFALVGVVVGSHMPKIAKGCRDRNASVK